MKQVYVSASAESSLLEYLNEKKRLGQIDNINLIENRANLDSAIACHPDCYMCRIGGGIYFGDADKLKPTYPDDVLYNAAAVGKYLVCSKYTSEDLINISGLIPIIVPQGYVKCNLAVIDVHHVITEDKGIYNVLRDVPDIECLLISEHEVRLKPYPYGFFGGCGGRVGSEYLFNGDLSRHSDFEIIKNYIEACGLTIKYFDSYPLSDIGSIITDF